jgi:hypothetical protein
MERVTITDRAIEVIDELRDRLGELMFHQSGGCFDGSSPVCFEKGDLKVGAGDVWLGQVYGCDFFMCKDQFEYWKHAHLTLDVTEGRGSSFSLEISMGARFMIRSRIFTLEELESLEPVMTGEEYLEVG